MTPQVTPGAIVDDNTSRLKVNMPMNVPKMATMATVNQVERRFLRLFTLAYSQLLSTAHICSFIFGNSEGNCLAGSIFSRDTKMQCEGTIAILLPRWRLDTIEKFLLGAANSFQCAPDVGRVPGMHTGVYPADGLISLGQRLDISHRPVTVYGSWKLAVDR
jgi:hypothetical protein